MRRGPSVISAVSGDVDVSMPADVVLCVYRYSGNTDIAGFISGIVAKSLHGFVDVAWPAAKGAELALQTVTGEVYTDQNIAFSTERRKNPVVGCTALLAVAGHWCSWNPSATTGASVSLSS